VFTTTIVVSLLLTALLVFTAGQKVRRAPQVVAAYERVGVAEAQLVPLAAILVLGGAGLTIGLAVPLVGVGAAAGLTAYFALAVRAHVRARELSDVAPPVVMLVLSVAALALRLLTS
jgi:hypothetical protein